MGAGAVVRRLDRGRWFVLAGIVGVLAVLALGPGLARAAACDTSWKAATSGDWNNPGNWTSGVPTNADNACITVAGTYTVSITGMAAPALSLQLGGASGTQTLAIVGAANNQATLNLGSGGAISSNGVVNLTANCATLGCVASPAASLVNAGAPLSNAGTITSAAGADSGANGRELGGDITNTGTIDVNAPLTYAVPQVLHAVGTLDNQGTLNLHSQTVSLLFDPIDQTTPTVKNDTGGTITNNGGTGKVLVTTSGRFIQAGGTTSPSTVNPSSPVVVLSDITYTDPLPVLSYTGGGSSAIEVRGGANLTGNIASGQSLNVNATSCLAESLVTAASSFSNAGTITLGGPCDSGLAITNGNLTNTGNLVLVSTSGGHTRELKGGLINSGTLAVNGNTAFDKSGAMLQQTGGSTTFPASGATLDTSGSGSTFQLQGGTLSGGGHTTGSAAIVNGAVSNTGGNLIPGSTTSPGIFSVNDYTQGAGGTLTAIVDGTSVGNGFSQLSSQGDATVGGTLAIDTLSGPSVGQIYTVLGASGTRSGHFSKATGLFAPEGPFPPGWTAGYKADYGSPHAVSVDADAAAGLRVKRAGPGTGSVTSSPGGINCGSKCDAPFFTTQTVTLTAHPGAGWVFGGWSGACRGSSIKCRVKMSQARTVTARFSHRSTTRLRSSRNPGKVGRRVTYTATVSPNPKGGKVRFTNNGKTISRCRAVAVNRATGKAKCSVTYRTPGRHRIKASYSGDGNFAPSSSATLTELVKR